MSDYQRYSPTVSNVRTLLLSNLCEFVSSVQENFQSAKKMTAGKTPLTASVFMIIMMKVFSGLTLTCHPAEYQIGNECCPKCPAGTRVRNHCTEFSSTSCLPCLDGTYTDKPNGLQQCASCTNCDSGFGLKIKRRCTAISDTVCEPMEGFYCADPSGDDCRAAQKHKRCDPGRYISQKGTASTDTECSACSSGTFSDGTLTSCQPHTQCESLNLQLKTAGTTSTDAQCGEKSSNTAAVVIPIVLLLLLITTLGLLFYFRKKLPCLNKDEKSSNSSTADLKSKEKQRLEAPESRTADNHKNIDGTDAPEASLNLIEPVSCSVEEVRIITSPQTG